MYLVALWALPTERRKAGRLVCPLVEYWAPQSVEKTANSMAEWRGSSLVARMASERAGLMDYSTAKQTVLCWVLLKAEMTAELKAS